jgi:hypothetical protein
MKTSLRASERVGPLRASGQDNTYSVPGITSAASRAAKADPWRCDRKSRKPAVIRDLRSYNAGISAASCDSLSCRYRHRKVTKRGQKPRLTPIRNGRKSVKCR